jgi:beta-mannosidase
MKWTVEILTLNGAWTLTKTGDDEAIPAKVPGCVHLDLLAAGRLEDPYYRDNELHGMWVGETDWTYRRTFDVSPDTLAHERVLLRCHGLDTVAKVILNGEEIARTDNMYRTYEWDVKTRLTAGENRLEIQFAAPMPYVRQQDAEKGKMAAWVEPMRLNGSSWLRKEPSNFGWDWGPELVTSGIWRDIELVAYDTARLDDVLILQDHNAGRVRLTVRMAAESANSANLSAVVQVTFQGETVIQKQNIQLNPNQAEADLLIDQPTLWWPNGMGQQPLYDVTVHLYDDQQRELDTFTRRIGLRVLKLERHADEWGESFHFSCNGVPFFAKGANWIPADNFVARLTRADYTPLIAAAADIHINMLRVWGGGIYEHDAFFDLCDEHGITVWHDFMFACGTYPAFDADFLANVEAEARDNVRRIRHHACMALWCGNNELEQGMPTEAWKKSLSWDDYSRLFDKLLPGIIAELDPQRDYWPSSPHSPQGDREDWMNPNWGDSHLWGVWHGKEPFEWYRTCYHRFVSEFGLQSFPAPETIYDFTLPEDRNVTSYVMEHHQRSYIGNSTVIHYMLDWFRLPTAFEGVIWLSQILQAMAMKYAVEHWRRNMPRCMGALYWQLNDLWPAPTWSSIDYRGRWKALHYLAKRFYAPVLISGLEDLETGTVEIHVTSDASEEQAGTVIWTLTNVKGDRLDGGEIPATIPPRQNVLIDTVQLSEHIKQHGPRDLLLWLSFQQDGAVVSDNLVFLARPKHLELSDPAIHIDIRPVDDRVFDVVLRSETPALYVWLELPQHEARFSDNFFALVPRQDKIVRLTLAEPVPLKTLQQTLVARSLVDTYR